MLNKEKRKLNSNTIDILKKIGVTHIDDNNYDLVFDMIVSEISIRVYENEDSTPPNVLKELDEFENALDDLNDHEEQGFDFDWINEQLAKR